MKRMSVERVRHAIKQLLTDNTVAEHDADLTAKVLIEGSIRGYHNHGVDRIFQILQGFTNQTLNPTPKITLVKDFPAMGVLDGDHGLGQPIGHYAMTQAIQKAKTNGMGGMQVRNSGHLGMLSYYAELASSENMFGVVLSNTSPAVVLPGTGKKYIGTNPICYSAPTDLDYPLTADFSTSVVSRGTILEYKEKQQKIPLEWAVNEHGIKTDDPVEALNGGIQCLDGGHKGFSISLLVGLLTGCLFGGPMVNQIEGTRYMTHSPNKGDLFLVFSIELLGDLEHFKQSMSQFSSDLEKYNSAYRFPGQRAHQTKAKQNQLMPLSDRAWQLFMDVTQHEYA